MDMSNISRRRVLQMSGAAAAAGVGVTGTATATHGQCQNGSGINGDDACDAYVTFNDQTVGTDCDGDRATDCSVNVAEAYLPCGGYIDIHDPDQDTTFFKAGVGIGATCYLDPGTYSDVCIDLYEKNCQFGRCVEQFWEPGKTCIETEQKLIAMLHLDTDGDEKYQHYCFHNADASPATGEDHAYLCNSSPPPVKDSAIISP